MKYKLFLWVCIIALTPAKGVLGIGKLMHHYYQHKEKNRSITVVEFLYNHYASEKHEKDGHPNTDHQLPFLKLDITSQLLGWNPFNSAVYSVIQPTVSPLTIHPLTKNAHVRAGVMGKIWQPPRLS